MIRRVLAILTLCFLAGVLVYCQTAKVIELSPDDAMAAKAKYDALQKAQTAWYDEQKFIESKYTKLPSGYKDGFSLGFTFSSDFRFLVPSSTFSVTSTSTNGLVYTWCQDGQWWYNGHPGLLYNSDHPVTSYKP